MPETMRHARAQSRRDIWHRKKLCFSTLGKQVLTTSVPFRWVPEKSLFAPVVLWNRHAQDRRLFRIRALSSLSSLRWQWTPFETQQLEQALRAQLQEDVFRRCYQERSAGLASGEERHRLFTQIAGELRDSSLHELMERQNHAVDWTYVAEKMNTAPSTLWFMHRSAASCQVHYLHNIGQCANREELNKGEALTLAQAADAREGFDWEAVARDVGSDWSAWQCFAHFQRSQSPWDWMDRKSDAEWRPEEDKLLIRICNEIGTNHWDCVAARLGDCSDSKQATAGQCTLRWAALTRRKSGRCWTSEERRRVVLGQQVYGCAWERVARHVPQRSLSLCANQWKILKAGVLGCMAWDAEQDRRLLAAVELHGCRRWQRVALMVPGRSSYQCWHRFMKLEPAKWSKSVEQRMGCAPRGSAMQRRWVTKGKGEARTAAAACSGYRPPNGRHCKNPSPYATADTSCADARPPKMCRLQLPAATSGFSGFGANKTSLLMPAVMPSAPGRVTSSGACEEVVTTAHLSSPAGRPAKLMAAMILQGSRSPSFMVTDAAVEKHLNTMEGGHLSDEHDDSSVSTLGEESYFAELVARPSAPRADAMA